MEPQTDTVELTMPPPAPTVTTWRVSVGRKPDRYSYDLREPNRLAWRELYPEFDSRADAEAVAMVYMRTKGVIGVRIDPVEVAAGEWDVGIG